MSRFDPNGEQNETPKILTPEEDKWSKAPENTMYVVTKKYGETVSNLARGFEGQPENRVEGRYCIEIPEEITDFCREISSLGGRALLVGGCVRDAVISKEHGVSLPTKDFDIEVYGLSPQTLNLILSTNYKDVRVEGAAFSVIKVRIYDGKDFVDVSIPRRESKIGSEHTEFSIEGDPSMSISEAAFRRDITINSLAYDPLTKTLYDFYNGVEDISNKVIRYTNEKAFQEDALRILRVMQFAARFDFSISPELRNLCAIMVERGDLDNISKERITEEFFKLITKGIKPSIGLEFCREIGILEKYWPQLYLLTKTDQDKEWHPEGNVWVHTLQAVDAAVDISVRDNLSEKDRMVLVLASLLHDVGKPLTTEFTNGRLRSHGHEAAGVVPAQEFLYNFIFPDIVKKQAVALIPYHLAPKYFWEQEVMYGINMDKAIRRLALRLWQGETNIYMLSLLVEADQRGRNPNTHTLEPLSREQIEDLDKCQRWFFDKAEELGVVREPPKKLLEGRDLLNHNIGRGIWIGLVTNVVYLDQLDGKIKSREEAIKAGLDYYKRFKDIVSLITTEEKIDERDAWQKIKRIDDPRIVLQSSDELVLSV